MHGTSFTPVSVRYCDCCAQVNLPIFRYMMHPSSFSAVNGNCWGCCAQVNLIISGKWCTSLPSPQWTEMVEAAVLRLICLFLVYYAPLFLHRSERKLLRLLYWGLFTHFLYMLHLSSFTVVNGNCWGCCIQVYLLISCIWCTSLPSLQWMEIVEAAVLRLICLVVV